MEKIETQPNQVVLDDVVFDDEIEDAHVRKWAAEVYDSLSLILTGDAFAIAWGAPDMNGLEPWRRVCQRYNPSTPASAVNALMRVMAPGRVTRHKDLPHKMDEWHILPGALRKDHGEDLSDNMQIATLLQTSPLHVRDLTGQSIDGASRYEGVRDRIRAVVSSILAQAAFSLIAAFVS